MYNKNRIKYYYKNRKFSLRKTSEKMKIPTSTLCRYMGKYNIKKRTCKEGIALLDRKGKNNPMYGRKGENHPAYKHGGNFYCVDCNKKLSSYKCKRCNKCYGKILSKKYKLKGHPNWNGGISFEPYSYKFTTILKEKVRKRDNCKCQNCKTKQKNHLLTYKDKLNIHHIDYNKFNCNEDNLITLCYKCNSKANYNRDYWYAYYRYKIEDNK